MKRNLLWLLSGLLVTLMLLVPASVTFALATTDQVQQNDDATSAIAVIKATPPAYVVSFREDQGLWETSDDPQTPIFYQAGAYHVGAFSQDSFVWGVGDVEVADLLLEVDLFPIAGADTNEAGIVFRQKDAENFYTFMVTRNGFFTLRKLVNSEWSDLIPWTAAEAMNSAENGVNRLGVMAEGPDITLLVNDVVVGQASDESFDSGSVGLSAGSFDADGIEVAFDDLQLWDLQNLSEPLAPATPTEDLQPTVEITATVEVTPTEEVTPEPTETPVPTPTPIDVSARTDAIRLADPTLSDEFRRDTGAWSLDSNEDVTYTLASRELSVKVNRANWMGWSLNNDLRPGDMLLEADVTLADGPENSEFGLIFRYQDNVNFYFFALSPLDPGSFSLWKNVAGDWTKLVDWSNSTALNTGKDAINRLAVLAEGPTITLLINETAVAQVDDETFTGGQVGLAAGTFDEPGAEVIFDNVDLWVLSEAEAATPVPTSEVDVTDTGEVLDAINTYRSADPVYTDEFRRDDGVWDLVSDTDVEHFYMRRSLHIRVDRTQWMSWSTQNDQKPADFLLEVDATHVSGPSDAEYGVIFRYIDDQNFYFFGISAGGYYSLWKRENDAWTILIDWTASDALTTGEQASNRLGILVRATDQGQQIALLANDTVLEALLDDTFTEGQIGLATGTFDEAGIEVAFDNLSLWTPATVIVN